MIMIQSVVYTLVAYVQQEYPFTQAQGLKYCKISTTHIRGD